MVWALLPRILEMQPTLPVIMITAYGKVSNVVDAIRAGAENFVAEAMGQREAAGRHSRRHRAGNRAEEELVQLKRALKQRYNFENIVGKSEPMLRLVRPGGAGGAQPLHRAGAGRERDGQGADRQGAARQLSAPQ